MEYLSIKEAVQYTEKSFSTIRKIVKNIQENQVIQYKGDSILKFELLKTGHKKIFILKRYLDNIYTSKIDNSQVSQQLKETIEILKKQLEIKDKQISEYSEQFTSFREVEEKAIQLITAQNEELKNLRTIERTSLMNSYFDKQIDVESIENIEEISKEPITFNDWLNYSKNS